MAKVAAGVTAGQWRLARAARRVLEQQRQERACCEPQRERSREPEQQHWFPALPELTGGWISAPEQACIPATPQGFTLRCGKTKWPPVC